MQPERYVPNAEQAEVPPEKITRYLLDLGSEDGHSKAVFFIGRGFSPALWSILAEALRHQVVSVPVVQELTSEWGTKYIVEGPLHCPDGSIAHVRTVWNIKPPSQNPRLVTAYPAPRARRIS